LRIDRFLFFIRLVKSRTLAQSLVETGISGSTAGA